MYAHKYVFRWSCIPAATIRWEFCFWTTFGGCLDCGSEHFMSTGRSTAVFPAVICRRINDNKEMSGSTTPQSDRRAFRSDVVFDHRWSTAAAATTAAVIVAIAATVTTATVLCTQISLSFRRHTLRRLFVFVVFFINRYDEHKRHPVYTVRWIDSRNHSVSTVRIPHVQHGATTDAIQQCANNMPSVLPTCCGSHAIVYALSSRCFRLDPV